MKHRRLLSIFLVVPSLAVSAHAVPPAAPTPRTGQDLCYKGVGAAIVDCAGTGQDGESRAGVAWPQPRFSDNGDRTVIDRLTGLSWSRDANPAGGYKTWRQALEHVRTLNERKYLGHADWRLPAIGEMESLVNIQTDIASWLSAQGFINVRKDEYWTSSTYAAYTRCAWSVGLYSGIAAGRGKGDGGLVWPVRSGRPGDANLPWSGQSSCYDDAGMVIDCAGTGQDGELRTGVAWPAPRFTRNVDRTVTDALTGLVWPSDGNAPGPAACDPGTPKYGQGALDYVKCLNASRYLGWNDWRLPNRNEIASLVNRGKPDGAAWLNTQGFSNVQAGGYWSSSTYVTTPWNAWGVNMHDGAVTSFARKHNIHVWPVRGGR